MGIYTVEKFNKDEQIEIGDLLMYEFESQKVTRAIRYKKDRTDSNRIIGVCTDVNDDLVTFTNQGITDVSVQGIICLGDKLILGETAGKAIALKYKEDSTIFGYRSVGKVIALYNNYNKAKVLLDIE